MMQLQPLSRGLSNSWLLLEKAQRIRGPKIVVYSASMQNLMTQPLPLMILWSFWGPFQRKIVRRKTWITTVITRFRGRVEWKGILLENVVWKFGNVGSWDGVEGKRYTGSSDTFLSEARLSFWCQSLESMYCQVVMGGSRWESRKVWVEHWAGQQTHSISGRQLDDDDHQHYSMMTISNAAYNLSYPQKQHMRSNIQLLEYAIPPWQSLSQNIARGTTDPCYWVPNWRLQLPYGLQIWPTELALVSILATR